MTGDPRDKAGAVPVEFEIRGQEEATKLEIADAFAALFAIVRPEGQLVRVQEGQAVDPAHLIASEVGIGAVWGYFIEGVYAGRVIILVVFEATETEQAPPVRHEIRLPGQGERLVRVIAVIEFVDEREPGSATLLGITGAVTVEVTIRQAEHVRVKRLPAEIHVGAVGIPGAAFNQFPVIAPGQVKAVIQCL